MNERTPWLPFNAQLLSSQNTPDNDQEERMAA